MKKCYKLGQDFSKIWRLELRGLHRVVVEAWDFHSYDGDEIKEFQSKIKGLFQDADGKGPTVIIQMGKY